MNRALPANQDYGGSPHKDLPPVKIEKLLAPFEEADLMTPNGHLNLLNADFSKKLSILQNVLKQAAFNPVMFEQSLLLELPEGAGLMPFPVFPKPSDAWTRDQLTGVPLPEGFVMPTANFYIYLASLLKIEIDITFAGVVEEIPGCPQYKVECSATMLLPSGETLVVKQIGKQQDLVTSKGTKQAHLPEMTKKKAMRNAVRQLLNLPLTMPLHEFSRPWLVFRPFFDANTAGEKVKAILQQRKDEAAEGQARLLGGSPPLLEATPMGEAEMANYRQRIEAVTTLDDLNEIMREIARTSSSSSQRSELRALCKDFKHRLETGEVLQASPANQVVDVPVEGVKL